MRFNTHWELENRHAFLGASKHHWTGYDLEKMKHIWENQFASERGVRRHRIAAELIKERIRLPEFPPTTLALYVNDAIGFHMTPEVTLKFSNTGNAFGTADAISFHKGVLRVHDLKTGKHPGHPKQLEIYNAYFCEEYRINPYDIEIENRIYQDDQYFDFFPEPSTIKDHIEKAREFDREIEMMKELQL